MSKILKHEFFALQVDESTDITRKAQLLVRWMMDDGAVVEDLLCCNELSETTKGQDAFDVLHSYFEHCGLSWKHCVGMCTDGAPAMTGHLKSCLNRTKSESKYFPYSLLYS